MQASSTQRPSDHRLAAITLLAATTFAVGTVFGGLAGLAAAPLTAPINAPGAAAPRAIDLGAPAVRLQRDGETTTVAGPSGGSNSALPRYQVGRGK